MLTTIFMNTDTFRELSDDEKVEWLERNVSIVINTKNNYVLFETTNEEAVMKAIDIDEPTFIGGEDDEENEYWVEHNGIGVWVHYNTITNQFFRDRTWCEVLFGEPEEDEPHSLELNITYLQ